MRLSDTAIEVVLPLGSQAAELALGIELGLEPSAGFADDGASGVLTTRSASWWNYRRCKTCGQTFRRGDRVLVDAVKRTVLHLVPGLVCGTHPKVDTSARGTGTDRAEFTAGLIRTWPAGVRLSLIGEDDWRLPRPGGSRLTPTCLYCGHTFRVGEYVVTCPCRTAREETAACGAAVHRDPAAGLPCWDVWQPGGKLTVCPTTTARL